MPACRPGGRVLSAAVLQPAAARPRAGCHAGPGHRPDGHGPWSAVPGSPGMPSAEPTNI